MFTLPDGKQVAITSGAVFAQVLASGEDGSRFKVQAVAEWFKSTAGKAIKEDIRGKEKDKGEEVAPFVSYLMKHGMSLSTARNRHSDVKALYYGWTHGVADQIGNANGWQASVDIARLKKEADDKEAQRVKDRLGVLAIRDQKEVEAEANGIDKSADEIKQEAAALYTEQQATKEAESKLKALTKKATDAGYMLVPLAPTVEQCIQVAAHCDDGIRDVLDALIIEVERLDNLAEALKPNDPKAIAPMPNPVVTA